MKIDIINDNGEVLYPADRTDVYQQKLSHRIVHIMVRLGDAMFIQKRDDTASYLPGYYFTSAGGHVDAGKIPEQAAKPELQEELGLESPLKFLSEFVFDDEHKRRIFLYETTLQGKMHLTEQEVSGGSFFTPKQILDLPEGKLHPQLMSCLQHMLNV